MQGEEANLNLLRDSLPPEVRERLKAKIEADQAFHRQVDADVALVTGGRSCSPYFVKRFNEANDRLAEAFPGGAWTKGDWYEPGKRNGR